MRTFHKFLWVGLLAVGFAAPASAGFIFTSDAYFVPGNGPQTSGAGLFSVEQAPIGSGVPLTALDNLGAGFSTGRGFIIRYGASATDLGGSVFINWTADRDYLSSGGLAAASIRAGFTIELADSQGGTANVSYEAGTTGSITTGPPTIFVTDPGFTFALTPDDSTKEVSQQATGSLFALIGSGSDSLRQNFLVSLSPTRVGQEFRIYLSPEVGITSILEAQQEVVVPEPSTIGLLAAALPLLGLGLARSHRTRRHTCPAGHGGPTITAPPPRRAGGLGRAPDEGFKQLYGQS